MEECRVPRLTSGQPHDQPRPRIRISDRLGGQRAQQFGGGQSCSEDRRAAHGFTLAGGEIITRGYALATVYCGTRAGIPEGWKLGIRAALKPDVRRLFQPDDGAVSAPGHGDFPRAMDYLENDSVGDAKNWRCLAFAVGKTALWAGARDERFRHRISNESGEGRRALAGAFCDRQRLNRRLPRSGSAATHALL